MCTFSAETLKLWYTLVAYTNFEMKFRQLFLGTTKTFFEQYHKNNELFDDPRRLNNIFRLRKTFEHLRNAAKVKLAFAKYAVRYFFWLYDSIKLFNFRKITTGNSPRSENNSRLLKKIRWNAENMRELN